MERRTGASWLERLPAARTVERTSAAFVPEPGSFAFAPRWTIVGALELPVRALAIESRAVAGIAEGAPSLGPVEGSPSSGTLEGGSTIWPSEGRTIAALIAWTSARPIPSPLCVRTSAPGHATARPRLPRTTAARSLRTIVPART